jgi:hypothetical protein
MSRKSDSDSVEETTPEQSEETAGPPPSDSDRLSVLEFKVAHLESIYGFPFDDGSEGETEPSGDPAA